LLFLKEQKSDGFFFALFVRAIERSLFKKRAIAHSLFCKEQQKERSLICKEQQKERLPLFKRAKKRAIAQLLF